MQPITKAIIPVAGFGTRFLPATKAQPKEMLPIVDKPIIQYIVEEAVESGITDIIIITSSNKRAVEDHFDRNFELEYRLKEKGKDALLQQVLSISELARITYVRQKTPLGDGHAILQAANLINDDEPVAVLFGDDVVMAETPCLKQLINAFKQTQSTVIALEQIDIEHVSKYGVIKPKDDTKRGKGELHEIVGFVEKPSKEEAPSNLAIIGKYIITPQVMKELENAPTGKDGELRLIDALILSQQKEKTFGLEFHGTRYDCGSKLGFLKATVDLGLSHAELKDDFAEFLKKRVC